jgi:hypothetical protein
MGLFSKEDPMKRFVVALVVLALSASAPLVAQKALNVNGTVKSVSATSLTITTAGKDAKDMTFDVDKDTKFVGKGLGTKSAQGQLKSATDAVAAGDKVRVTYHDMSGKMHAANVNITAKGTVGAKK